MNRNSVIWKKVFESGLERQYLDFHRSLLGLNRNTRREVVFAEFGKYPLCLTYWCRCLTYWNKTVELGPSRLPYIALVDSICCRGLSLRGYAPCWFSAFSTLVQKFGVAESDLFAVEGGTTVLK